ncbi:hypothetical protein ACIBO2_11200 [Nonomuraea sp. NPDC050022]|uniref:WXG100-like domain-containing protein n=1 Tax=unclassified Nonomuraea TaxID=2593643 RepID=UPI0033FAA6BB
MWETEKLPDWVVYWLIPMLMSGQAWPEASESGLWRLREAHRRAVDTYVATFEPTGTAVRTIAAGWESPAKPVTFTRVERMYDEQTGALAKMAAHHQYAQQADAFALETQYSKISINVAFWVAVIAIAVALLVSFFSAGATAPLVGPAASSLRLAIRNILTRLGIAAARPAGVTAAGRLTTLAGGTLGRRFMSAALTHELIEEIGEEVFIDAFTQYKQIQMGTRLSWDWDKTMAAAVGAGVGAVAGTKLGAPVSRLTSAVPGISHLNRTAGDLPGWGNAFRRFPGRALNTGLNNVVASPAGSFVANGLVYGQWEPPTADSLVGGFMGGAGRTNTISPFNPSVAGAVLHPMSALNSAMDTAAATDLTRTTDLAQADTDTRPNTDPDTGARPGTDGRPGTDARPAGGPQAPPNGTGSYGGPVSPTVPPQGTPGEGAPGGPGRATAEPPMNGSRPVASPGAPDTPQTRQPAPPPGDPRPAGDPMPSRAQPGSSASAPEPTRPAEPAPAETARPTDPATLADSTTQADSATRPNLAAQPDPQAADPSRPGRPASIDDLINRDTTPRTDDPIDRATAPRADDPIGRATAPHTDGLVSRDTAPRTAVDHATRTPTLNMDPPPRSGQTLANVRDPRNVPLAARWEPLRGSATPEPITVPHTEGAAQVEARRLLVPWRGGLHPVTEFTVRVQYRADPRLTPEEIADAHARLLEGIDLYYNHQHQLADGSLLHVRMEFVAAPDEAPDGTVVLLHPGTGTRAADFADRESWHSEGEVISTPLDQLRSYRDRPPIHYLSWYAGMEPVVFAHETLHLLGMLDEYVHPLAEDRRDLAARDVHADSNLLGQAQLFWSAGRPVLDRDGRTVAETAGLRDRHLEHLFALLPESDQRPKVSLTRPAPVAPAEEWSRPEFEPAGRLPGNVLRLVEEFPSDGRPLVEHLRLLERMDGLFADGRPLTNEHLAYTDALVRMTQDIYGTGPEYSFAIAELAALKHLAELLLGDSVPQLDLLRTAVNALLGRDATTPVTTQQIHLLVRLAATVSPHPGEPGADTLRRAIQSFRRSMPGVVQLRRAGISLPTTPAQTDPSTKAQADPTATAQADPSPGPSADSSTDSAPNPTDGLRSSLSPTGDRNADSDPRQFLRFWRDLMNQVRAEAHRRGTAPLDELQQFALQRAIGRIFAANPDDWMLKGGQAMLSRNPGGRASTDIDLVRMSGNPDPDAMADEYEAALARDHGDQLRFVRESKVYILHGKAVRMAHTVYCGDMEIMRLSVDLAPPRTRAVWKEPEIIPFPQQILATGHPDESPRLRVISYHDTLAHKVSGIYTHGIRTLETRCHDCIARGKGLFSCKAGDLPYRCQDLVDILMIILNSSWDGPATHAMLHAEFAWRLEQGENLKVPSAFEIPSPDWFRKFDQYARTTPGLPYAGLTEAIPVAQAFLDPLLREEAPPPSRWDPNLRRWVETDDVTAPDASGDTVAPDGTADVRHLQVPSTAPASAVHADPDMIATWDRLSAGDLDAELSQLKQRTNLSPAEKVDFIRSRMMYDSGYVELTRVPGPDNQHFKHLRFYAHQRGELYSHAAALMADPDTTVEIAYEPDRGFKTFQWDAHQSHLAYLGALPSGITLDEANAAVLHQLIKGRTVNDPAALVDALIELHAKPLRDALALRQRLIDEYGIEPHRVRLAFANTSQKSHYSESQWMRAQLFALRAIQADPVQARQRMVDAMLGPDEATAARRAARAQAVIDRLHQANGQADRQANGQVGEYALLWVRDTRGQPVGGRHGPHLDTRPEVLRQTIEALHARHPGRRVVLLGDDIFAGRPELEEAWRQEGVLDGVDTRTLVEFWAAEHNGGQALSYAEQGLFFHRLTTQSDVVQIGMESGALEIPAMLGVPTVYFEAREHDGNKGNRWQLYWQDWAYGDSEPVLDEQGNPRFDPSGRPITRFVTTETSRAPLPAMRRLLFGPDLPDPANRRGQPVAVYYPARVAVTVDRINRLIRGGELDQWPDRLGRSATLDGDRWTYWSEEDWKRSAYYAEQLRRWVRVDARTPEEAGRKWHGIRLALLGVLEPQFTVDQEYEGVSLAHPYAVLHLERSRIDVDAIRISRAYGLDPGERATAVANAIKSLLDSPGFARQALDDLRLFQLDRSEVRDLGEAVGRVTAAPVRPYADRLDVPLGDGQPTPRQVLDRFDATRAGLPEVSAREAAAYIARHAATRPWLAAAASLDPAVQRVLVAIDQGQGHHLARHGAFAADGRLHGRVARLEDPAQLDEELRGRATDAFRPGDLEHRCPDTATAIHDPVAFAVAFARALEHPLMRAALATPFNPDQRPGRVSLPIGELLGPDGHLYCAGFRIVPVDGSPETAVANRLIWVRALRAGERPGVPEPQATPMESFDGGTVEFFFQVNGQRDGYEISTMFADPPPPER